MSSLVSDEELVECVEQRLRVCKSKIMEIKAKCRQKLDKLTSELVNDSRLHQEQPMIIAERAYASISRFKIELNLLLELADDELSNAPLKIVQNVRQTLNANSSTLQPIMPQLEQANDDNEHQEAKVIDDDDDDDDDDIQILNVVSPSPAMKTKNSMLSLEIHNESNKNTQPRIKQEETHVSAAPVVAPPPPVIVQKPKEAKKHRSFFRRKPQIEVASPIPSKRARLSSHPANANTTHHSNDAQSPAPNAADSALPTTNTNSASNDSNNNDNKQVTKRKRGRPRKTPIPETTAVANTAKPTELCHAMEHGKREYEMAKNQYIQTNSYWQVLQTTTHQQEVFNNAWRQLYAKMCATNTWEQIYRTCQLQASAENEAERRRVNVLLQQHKNAMDAAQLRLQRLQTQLQPEK